jgi:hypothetical protein
MWNGLPGRKLIKENKTIFLPQNYSRIKFVKGME